MKTQSTCRTLVEKQRWKEKRPLLSASLPHPPFPLLSFLHLLMIFIITLYYKKIAPLIVYRHSRGTTDATATMNQNYRSSSLNHNKQKTMLGGGGQQIWCVVKKTQVFPALTNPLLQGKWYWCPHKQTTQLCTFSSWCDVRVAVKTIKTHDQLVEWQSSLAEI